MDADWRCCVVILFLALGFKDSLEVKLPEVVIKGAQTLSPNEALLSWETGHDVKKGKLKYLVRYKIKGGRYKTFKRIPTTKPEVTLRGLTGNTVYTAAVRTLKGRYRGPWSESLDFITPVVSPGKVETQIRGKVYIDSVGTDHAAITWNLTDNSEPVMALLKGFRVTWRDRSLKYEEETQQFNATLPDLVPGQSYIVVVSFLKNTGGKVKIGTLKFQTNDESLSAPRNLKLKSHTDKEASMKWRHITNNDPDVQLTGYVIQYKRRSGEAANMCRVKVDNSTRSLVLKGLYPDTKYAIRVAGKYDNVTGPFTDWLRMRTSPEMANNTEVWVYHVSPTEVMLLWQPFTEESSITLDLYTFKSDSLELVRSVAFERFEAIFLEELVPGTLYKAEIQERGSRNCTMYRAIQWTTQTVDCQDDCLPSSATPADTDLPLLSEYYESALRILPISAASHVITWAPFDYFQNNMTFMYVLRILGEPFLFPLETHLISGGSTHHVIHNLDLSKTFSINLLVFEQSRNYPVFSSYHLIVHPVKDLPMTNTTVSYNIALPRSETSMDILVNKSHAEFITGDILRQTITGSDVVLISKMFPDDKDGLVIETNDTQTSLTLKGLHFMKQETPYVETINNQTAREGDSVYVTCLARGDPYPIVSWINKTADDVMIASSTNETDRISITAPRYVGSSSLVSGKAFLGMKRFLSIGPVQVWDSGLYACLAENTEGEHQAVFRITVRPKPPGPVRELVAWSPTPFEIFFTWKSPQVDTFVPEVSQVRGFRVLLLDEYDVTLREKTVEKPGTEFLDVEPSTLYKVMVSAYNEIEEGEQVATTVQTSGIPQLGPPNNVSVRTFNGTTLIVSWFPPSVVHFGQVRLRTYLFHHRKSGDRKSEEMQLPKNVTTVSVNDLTPEQKYEVQVIALSEDGQVAGSSWREGATFRENYMDESREPPPPLNVYLRAEAGDIIVSWLPPYPDENVLVRAYEIVVFNNGTKREVMKVGYKESSVIVYEVEMGVHYRISVQAVNNAGTSIEEAQELYIPMEHVTELPVQNFRGEALSSTQLELRWERPPGGVFTHYMLSYTLSGNEAPELPGGGILPQEVDRYIVRSLKPYTEYLFSITPFLKRIRGVTSNVTVLTLSDRPTEPPDNVTLTPINATTVLITSFPPLRGKNGVITTYKISYRTKYTWRSDIVVTATESEELFEYVTGLIHSTVYEFRVRALTVNGSGPWSTWLQTKTPVPAPVKPKVPKSLWTSSNSNSITVSWDPPNQDLSYITGYVVGWGQFLPEVNRESVTKENDSYVIQGLDPATVYIVSVRSFNEYGESVAIFELTKTGLG